MMSVKSIGFPSIQFRILGVILSGGIIALTAFLIYWTYNETSIRHDMQLSEINQVVMSRRVVLKSILERQFTTLQMLSNSVELRRHILNISQQYLDRPVPSVLEDLKSIESGWKDSAVILGSDDQTTSSLVAKFLRDAAFSSGEYITQLIVTDALGAVRIAMHDPERFLYFDESWWQQALFLTPGHLFPGEIRIVDRKVYWFVSVPLRNDDGTDSVGVIRASIRLDKIMDEVASPDPVSDEGIYLFFDEQLIYPKTPPRFFNPQTFETGRLRSHTSGFIEDQHYIARYTSVLDIIPNAPIQANLMLMGFFMQRPVLSPKTPPLRDAILIWSAGVLMLLLVSLILSRWITIPLSVLTQGVHEITNGKFSVRIPYLGRGEINILAQSFNQMVARLHETRQRVQKMIKFQQESLTIITKFIQELSQVNSVNAISRGLVESCLQATQANAAMVFLPEQGTVNTPPVMSEGTETIPKSTLQTLASIHPQSRMLAYSWSHRELISIWNANYQVLLSIPITSQERNLGVIHLLFVDAPEIDLEAYALPDLLAHLAAISITRRQLHEEVMLQKVRLEGILSGISGLICIIDRGMRIVWCSPGTPEFLNPEPPKDLEGSLCCSLFRHRDRICPDCPVKLTFQDGRNHRILQRWPDINGKTRWIEAASYPVRSDTPLVSQAILMCRDVTQRIHEEIVVQRFSHAIENIAEGVAILNLDGHFEYTNPAFNRLFSDDPRDILGNPFSIIFPLETIDLTDQILTQTKRGAIWADEVELIGKDRKRTPVALSTSLIVDSLDAPTGIIVTCRDISEVRKRERDLIRRFRALHILNQVSQILNRSSSIDTMLNEVLIRMAHFTGASSGAILLIDPESSKPKIGVDLNLPQYLVKYFDEIREGRKSNWFDRMIQQTSPVINDDLKEAADPEKKMLSRLGFNSLASIRMATPQLNIGCIILLASESGQFSNEDLALFDSISAQLSISIQTSRLHERMLREAGMAAVGHLVNEIGGDIKQVLQGFESTSHLIDQGFQRNDLRILAHGWELVSREIWQLMIITVNILEYTKEYSELFFPEDPVSIVVSQINYLKTLRFSHRFRIGFQPADDLKEVYANKVILNNAVMNLLALAVEGCHNLEEPSLWIELLRSNENYLIRISHDIHREAGLPMKLEKRDRDIISGNVDINLSLAIIRKAVKAHRGDFRTVFNEQSHRFIYEICLPIYPIRKRKSQK